MTRNKRHRDGCIAIGLVLLLLALVVFTPAMAQESTPHKNPYVVRTFVDEKGRQIDEVIFPGRPPEIKAEAVMVPEPNIVMGTNSLPDVPAFDWSYGCSATSGAMMVGYYDRTGYSNMYTGPTNGGVCPLDNSVWGHTTYPKVISGECPLSATHQGKDGRETRGHVDDYWIDYGSTAKDPFIKNGWPEHAYGDCTGDYMKTNQYNYNNFDGSTTFYFYTNGAATRYTDLYPSYHNLDGCCGLKMFFESRGYTVTDMYNQYIEELELTYGFTFDQYKAEIDAGRPVMIHVEGHSMLGCGYNDPDTVYLHNTWDYNSHSMTWGGSYSDMQHYGVTIVQLAALPPPEFPEINSCNSEGGAQTYFQPGGSVYVQGSNFVPGTNYKIWIQDTPVNESDLLVTGEDDSGSQETVTTTGSGTLSPTLAWAIPSGPFVHHDYDIIVDKQSEGAGYYNAASDGKVSFHVGMCGDVAPYPNGDGVIDIGDVILLHNHILQPENPRYVLSSVWAGNCRCDGIIDIGDIILLHNHILQPYNPRYALNCCD
ncbi:MAG: hypothetical protein JW945_02205 [Methanomicrobia archaeon]|nr:hypothetical protein [Methanomicrobia archaeon]